MVILCSIDYFQIEVDKNKKWFKKLTVTICKNIMYFKISKIFILISFFGTTISSCKKDRKQENDSYESYRYELWKNLVDNKFNFELSAKEDTE